MHSNKIHSSNSVISKRKRNENNPKKGDFTQLLQINPIPLFRYVKLYQKCIFLRLGLKLHFVSAVQSRFLPGEELFSFWSDIR